VPVLTLPEGSWWDWEVIGWDRGALCLAAGWDLTYHHDLEVRFAEAVYVACPDSFHDPVFREPSGRELKRLRHLHEDSRLRVYAFDAEPFGGSEGMACVIVAASVEVVPGVVYRYWREDLGPGERRAPWVQPPPGAAG
jgi:hypothetical protein